MSQAIRSFITIFTVVLLSACATSLDGERYRGQSPGFDLFAFFDGNVKAWGIVQDRSGEITQRFTVDIKGTVDNQQLRLDETFHYSLGDGVTERVWIIDRQANGRYSGRADDILGEAYGEAFGNAFRWTYAMDLPVGDNSYEVTFEDWIWQLDDNSLINRSWIQKFGIDFAEVTLFMQRVD